MMVENIPLPRLLANSPSWTERRITPTKVSINLSITPLSEATMELPRGESVPARGYVELFTCMGSAGIYRVRSPRDAYGDDITTAELEHAVVEVGDYLVLSDYNVMMAATTAFSTIFSYYRGSLWTLGNISALGSDQVAVNANYVRVLEALIAIMDQKPDCMMDFDFSTTPWTINVRKRGTTVAAEGRLSRNVNYANVTYDDTELCTRVYYEKETDDGTALDGYPTFSASDLYAPDAVVTYNGALYQLPDGHEKNVTWANTTKTALNDVPSSEWTYIDAETIADYGLVERTVPTGSDYTEDEALQVAAEYLKNHRHPRISVEISLEELSSITGEPLDTFEIGKLCRLALVDYGVTVEKHITGLGFADVYEQPRNITANLAEEEDAAINFIHDIDSKGGSGGGGGSAKKQDEEFKEFWTQFYRDDYKINLIAAQSNKARGILKAAGIDIDANGVAIYATDKTTNLQSKIDVQAGRIDLVVQGEGPNAQIKPAEIVAAINDGVSTIKISADHIDIDGLVEYLKAVQLDVYTLTVSSFTELHDVDCGNIDCSYITTNNGNADIGGTATVGSLVVDSGGTSSLSTASCDSMSVAGLLSVLDGELQVGGYRASWQSYSARFCSLSATHDFQYTNNQAGTSTLNGRLVTGYTDTTIYYLGRTVSA